MAVKAMLRRSKRLFASVVFRGRRSMEGRQQENNEAEEARRHSETERRRGEVLRRHEALRVFMDGPHELLGREVDRFVSRETSESSLQTIVAVANAVGLEYFLVPGRAHTRFVIGLRDVDRARFITAVQEHLGRSEWYVGRPTAAERFSIGPVALADGPLPEVLASAPFLRFGRYLLGPHGQILAGLEHGCDVEFWEDGVAVAARADFAERQERMRVKLPAVMMEDALVAPRANHFADVLPAEVRTPAMQTVGDHEYRSFAAFDELRATEVDFPIDAVYTWVDGADPVWAEQRRRHLGGEAAAQDHLSGASRYVSRDELKYSLRSLWTFAPFIRNIYIVTAGQTPPWLDASVPGITVVDHTDIFADPSVLPVFNSHAIGAQLHRIPSLSEHYIYINDDVFFGRPVTASKFFHANGIAKVPLSSKQIGLGRPRSEESAPNSAGKNVRELLHSDFGRFITAKCKHLPHPQLRSLAFELEERYAESVARTVRARFRSPNDIAFASLLHHHYGIFTGRAVPGGGDLRYIDIAYDDAVERLEALVTKRDAEFFCVNDVDTSQSRAAEMDELVPKFLERYFPFQAPWEK